MTRPCLVLFDLDRTLLKAGPEPVAAMTQAGRHVMGENFSLESVNRSGNLDPLIFKQACVDSGYGEPTSQHLADFHQAYLQRVKQTGITVRALTHAAALVNDLISQPDVYLGVVTGNFQEVGWMKIKQAGLDASVFIANGFGCQKPVRSELVAFAVENARVHTEIEFQPNQVLVVGDTPKDVKAAREYGCPVWAVTTGHYDATDLAEADCVTDQLPQTAEALLAVLD